MNGRTAKAINYAADVRYAEVIGTIRGQRKERLTEFQEKSVYNHIRHALYRLWYKATKNERRNLRKNLVRKAAELVKIT